MTILSRDKSFIIHLYLFELYFKVLVCRSERFFVQQVLESVTKIRAHSIKRIDMDACLDIVGSILLTLSVPNSMS